LYALSGKLDLVVFLKDGLYAVIDFKTGWTILNADRPKIIRDIQMTLYAYAATTIFKRPPTYLILQPVDLPKGALHTPGAVEALRRQRIVVPPRTQAHYEELGNLIEDIRRMRELIAAHDGPAREARDAWEPVSAWGKQAGLKQNAVEGRYIPRIGRWCARCQFREVCREENAIDWAAYQKDALEARAPATQPAETPLVRVAEDKGQLRLDTGKIRPLKLRKGDADTKRSLLASPSFIAEDAVSARVRDIARAIPVLPNGTVCPCRRLKRGKKMIVPLAALAYVGPLLREEMSLPEIGKRLADECMYLDCPHRVNTAKEAS
jgi:hypothetical protein